MSVGRAGSSPEYGIFCVAERLKVEEVWFMQSIHEFCEGLMSFIDSNPESLCVVELFGAKREIPKWMEDLGSECISSSLRHAMDILKDKDRYDGRASLYVESKDNPEIPFPIPFIDYGNIDADRLKERCPELLMRGK